MRAQLIHLLLVTWSAATACGGEHAAPPAAPPPSAEQLRLGAELLALPLASFCAGEAPRMVVGEAAIPTGDFAASRHHAARVAVPDTDAHVPAEERLSLHAGDETTTRFDYFALGEPELAQELCGRLNLLPDAPGR